jgi:hypothetical protein
MRFFLLTSIIIIIVTVIKIDLTEGTVPLIAFSESVDQCNEQLAVKTVPVITKEGDTLQGLLAQYPTDERISVPERMVLFLQLNLF